MQVLNEAASYRGGGGGQCSRSGRGRGPTQRAVRGGSAAQLEAKQRVCTQLQVSPTVYSFLSTCGTAAGRRGDEGQATGGVSTVAPPTHPPPAALKTCGGHSCPPMRAANSSRAHLFPGEEASQREGPDAAEHAHHGQQPAGGGVDCLDLREGGGTARCMERSGGHGVIRGMVRG